MEEKARTRKLGLTPNQPMERVRLAVVAIDGDRAGVPHARAAAEWRVRNGIAVAALVRDAGVELHLRLVDRRLDDEIGLAGGPVVPEQPALLVHLLDRDEVLDPGLADRLLTVVLGRVAEILLCGLGGGAAERRADGRGGVERAAAELDRMRGVECAEEVRQLGPLPAQQAVRELARCPDRERRAGVLDAGGRRVVGAVDREAERREIRRRAGELDLGADLRLQRIDLELGRRVRTRSGDLRQVLVVDALADLLQVRLLELEEVLNDLLLAVYGSARAGTMASGSAKSRARAIRLI